MNKISRVVMISVLPFAFSFMTACTLFRIDVQTGKNPAQEINQTQTTTQPTEEVAKEVTENQGSKSEAVADSLMTNNETNLIYGALGTMATVGIAVAVRYLQKKKK